MAEIGAIALGVGVAIGLAALGSGIGQGIASAAAAGATAENEDLYVKELTFAILPETQAIYGFIVAMLLIAIGTGLVTLG